VPGARAVPRAAVRGSSGGPPVRAGRAGRRPGGLAGAPRPGPRCRRPWGCARRRRRPSIAGAR